MDANWVTYERLFTVLSFLLAFAVAVIEAVRLVLDLIDKHNKKK